MGDPALQEKVNLIDVSKLPIGQVLGAVRITGFKPYKEKQGSPWALGPGCMELGVEVEDVVTLPEPIERKGRLGFWQLTPEDLGEANMQALEKGGMPLEDFLKRPRLD